MTQGRIIFAEFVVEGARSTKNTRQVTYAVNFFAVGALANDLKQKIVTSFDFLAIFVSNFNRSVEDIVGMKPVTGMDND